MRHPSSTKHDIYNPQDNRDIYLHALHVRLLLSEGGTSITGPGCSKLTTSLVNVSLKFQTLRVHHNTKWVGNGLKLNWGKFLECW